MFQSDGTNDRKPGPGRPKGSKNQWTGMAKTAFMEVFEHCGGVEGMVEWVNNSPRGKDIFYGSVMPKLIPVQVTGEGDGPVAIQIVTGVPRADADS